MREFWVIYGNLINTILLNCILAYSVYICLSSGLFAVHQVGFMSLGAFTSAILSLRYNVPFAVGLLAAGLLAAVIAFILGLIILRLKGVYLALATIGFVEIVRQVAINIPSLTGGAWGLDSVPRQTETWHLIVFLCLLIYLFFTLRQSRTGRALRAINCDGTAAATMGIYVVRYRTFVFIGSAMIAAVAGGFDAHLNYIVVPSDYGFARVINVLTFVVLGGATHWIGPVVGAAIITSLPEFLRGITGYRDVVNGALLILIMIYLPGGLADPLRWRRWFSSLRTLGGKKPPEKGMGIADTGQS